MNLPVRKNIFDAGPKIDALMIIFFMSLSLIECNVYQGKRQKSVYSGENGVGQMYST